MRNYKNYEIWKAAIEIVKTIYTIANKLPKEETYGLKSQITRAAISIPSNIAEGTSRNSDKEFKRFLEISIGSVFELETQLTIIKELELIEHDFNKIFNLLDTQSKKTNSLISKLK